MAWRAHFQATCTWDETMALLPQALCGFNGDALWVLSSAWPVTSTRPTSLPSQYQPGTTAHSRAAACNRAKQMCWTEEYLGIASHAIPGAPGTLPDSAVSQFWVEGSRQASGAAQVQAHRGSWGRRLRPHQGGHCRGGTATKEKGGRFASPGLSARPPALLPSGS